MNYLREPNFIQKLFCGLGASLNILAVWDTETNQTYMNHVWLSLVFAAGISTVALSLGFDPMAKRTGKVFYTKTKLLVYAIVYILTFVKFAPLYHQTKDYQNFTMLWICAGLMWLVTNVVIHVLVICYTTTETRGRSFFEVTTIMEECVILFTSIISIIMALHWAEHFVYIVSLGPALVWAIAKSTSLQSVASKYFFACRGGDFVGLFRLSRSALNIGSMLAVMSLLKWVTWSAMKNASLADMPDLTRNGSSILDFIEWKVNHGTKFSHVNDINEDSDLGLGYPVRIATACYVILYLHRIELRYIATTMVRKQIMLELINALQN